MRFFRTSSLQQLIASTGLSSLGDAALAAGSSPPGSRAVPACCSGQCPGPIIFRPGLARLKRILHPTLPPSQLCRGRCRSSARDGIDDSELGLCPVPLGRSLFGYGSVTVRLRFGHGSETDSSGRHGPWQSRIDRRGKSSGRGATWRGTSRCEIITNPRECRRHYGYPC